MELNKFTFDKELVMQRTDIPVTLWKWQGGEFRVALVTDDDFVFNLGDIIKFLGYAKTPDRVLSSRSSDNIDYDNMVIKLSNKNVSKYENGAKPLNNFAEIFLTEEGLYNIIADSRKELARDFRKWVFGEVLPMIRKYGYYDITHSKMKKLTIKGLPGWNESENLKKKFKDEIQVVAKATRQLKGVVWNNFVDLWNKLYSTNLRKEISAFTKKNHLDESPNIREYIDYSGKALQAYVVFSLMKNNITCIEDYVSLQILCKWYYKNMDIEEKAKADFMLNNATVKNKKEVLRIEDVMSKVNDVLKS